MKPILPILILFAFLSTCASATASASSFSGLNQLQFLVGDWKGELGGSMNGSDMGNCNVSFKWDLQKKVIVSRLASVYPAQNGKPGYTYEALTVISQDPNAGSITADDYDSVTDVVHFILMPSTQRQTAVFLSRQTVKEPPFLFTYHLTDKNTCTIDFEIQSTGKSKSFVSFATGKIVRIAAS